MRFTSTIFVLALATVAIVALMTVVAAPSDYSTIYRAPLLLVY